MEKTYWDYVLPALARHRCMDELFEEFDYCHPMIIRFYDDPAEFREKDHSADFNGG